MKNNIIFFTLFLLHNSITTTAENIDLNRIAERSAKLFEEAQKNISPQLNACTTFQCIEQLLYQEEKEAIDAYFNACKVPKTYQDAFHASFAENLRVIEDWHRKLFSYWISPRVIHDKKGISTTLINDAKKIISDHDLDPNYINIVRNDEYFKNNPNVVAQATTSGFMLENPLKIVMNTIATLTLNVNHSALDTHTIAHEVTHIKERHGYKLNSAQEIAAKFKTVSNPEIEATYSKWEAICEKQAELFPLLRLTHENIAEQLLRKIMAPALFSELPTHGSAIHPECSELLPYLIKIESLKNNGARPLYEMYARKNKPSFSSTFSGGISAIIAVGLCYCWHTYKAPVPLRITNH